MVSLHNNLGWTLHDAGRFTEAMVEFQLAEQWAERVGTPRQQQRAREAIAECEHSLAAASGLRIPRRRLRQPLPPGETMELTVPPQRKAFPVIFIVVKFKVKPDWSERWLGLVEDFTQATRQEPGNLWFDWSRSVEDPNEFVLVEAFKDDAAGDHVNSAHFKQAMADMPQALAETPRIISRQFDGDGWDRMGELTI